MPFDFGTGAEQWITQLGRASELAQFEWSTPASCKGNYTATFLFLLSPLLRIIPHIL